MFLVTCIETHIDPNIKWSSKPRIQLCFGSLGGPRPGAHVVLGPQAWLSYVAAVDGDTTDATIREYLGLWGC